MSLIPDDLPKDEQVELVARLLGISIKEAEEIIKSESLNTIGYDVFDDGKPHVGVSIFDV